jgi:hypothetical protein
VDIFGNIQINYKMKKQKSFADVAKDIKKRYTRADFDPIERRDMEKELRKLRDEQEEERSIMDISKHANNMDKVDGGDLNTGVGNIGGMNQRLFSMMPQFGQYKTEIGKYNPIGGNKLVDASSNNLNTLSNKYGLPQTSMFPFAVSAGMSAIGDITGMRYMNKNMPSNVNLPRVNASTINLQPQREALQRGYNTASNTMLKNSRDVSSPGNAYANQIAGISGLTDSLGTQMGSSFMNEENTNAQIKNRASEANAEIGSREAIMNAQLKGNKAQVKGQYINSLANTIPLALRDYNQQASQTNWLNTQGKDYGVYEKVNPNETFAQYLARLNNNSKKYIKNRDNPNLV